MYIATNALPNYDNALYSEHKQQMTQVQIHLRNLG